MNFFEHQERARRQTRRMLFLFALAVLAIVAATDIVVLFAFGVDRAHHAAAAPGWPGIALLSVGIVVVILLASAYRIATLGNGGATIAREFGGTPVDASTTDFAYRRLRNVVEEVAIASGTPVPDIFVLEDEAGINAFASGYTPADAAITVTRGALDKLTRDELQGVIGHEFSHVLNGDMRLNIRLIGVVFGILVLATIGRRIAWMSGGRGRGRSSGGNVALFGIALFVVGYIGVVFARLIKASISRQREFLADASAVQFTRQTSGIAGALKKIGALVEGSRLAASEKEEVAHMLFGDGVGYSALFATHPPLVERIRRLDPTFRDAEYRTIAAAWSAPVRVGAAESDDADVSISGFAPAGAHAPSTSAPGDALPSAASRVSVSPPRIAAQVGQPDTGDERAARAIRTTIPDALKSAAYRQEEAALVVLALLVDAREDVRARQLAAIASAYDPGSAERCEAIAGETATLHPALRLPLAALAFPALRRRPRPELARFLATMRALIAADGRTGLGEYCLSRLVQVQVVDALSPASASTIGRVRLPEAKPELADLLAVVARNGHDDEDDARRAYLAGFEEVMPGAAIPYAPPADWIDALDRALADLDRLAPAGKELVVRGLTRAISHDGVVSVAEAELLRTICAALHCPLPPLIDA